MVYFDNKFLMGYLTQGKKVTVKVNNKMLNLSDKSDVINPNEAVGTDAFGKVTVFDYQDIEQIQVGSNIITLDALQGMVTDKPKPESPPKSDTPAPEKEKPTDKEPPPEDKEEVPKEPTQDGYTPSMVGRSLVREFLKSKR